MAIQAQYPSNLLNVQEGKNPFGGGGAKYDNDDGGGGGAGGLFADQTNSFNYAVGTNHSIKLRRETDATTPLMSTQQPQFYTSPKNVVSIGLGLSFDDHHHHHQQQQIHWQQQQYSNSPQCSTHSSAQRSFLSEELVTHINQQGNEIEHFLLAQREQLRRSLSEKRQSHYRTIINAAEVIFRKRLKEKEVEVGMAVRRHAELEAKANHLSLEAQAWQARARMQENYAATLKLQLEEVIIADGGGCGRGQGGEESRAGVNGVGQAEDKESAYIDPDRVVVSNGPICRSCRKRDATMVLLPCRHMCLCTECDVVAQACPACLTVRSSSIEVIFS